MRDYTIDPNPMQIGGFKPVEKSFNLKKYGITYQISTSTRIGYFKPSHTANLNLKKLEQSKIIEIPHAPKSCRICGGYMQLRTNGEGYRCLNKDCLDKRGKVKIYKKDLRRRGTGKKPIMSRISTAELERLIRA